MKNKKMILILMTLLLLSGAVVGYIYLHDGKYDINTMDEGELRIKLKELANIGDTLADRIIENRPYNSMDDIDDLPRIGRKTIDKINKYFKVSEVYK